MIRDFAALPTPYRAFATDIAKGRGAALDQGALYRAVRASISLPLVFPPVAVDGRFLVDGGLLDNNPVDLALDWGADIIIDVDVASFVVRDYREIDDIEAVTDQTLRLIQSTSIMSEHTAGRADFLLDMDLSDFFWSDFSLAQQLIDRGEEIARQPENLAALQALALRVEADGRALEQRDWRRTGAYFDRPAPVFTSVRLESLTVEGEREDPALVEREFSRKYLDQLFGPFYGVTVDNDALTEALEILRLRGGYENLGYHLEAASSPAAGSTTDGPYTLVLTGLRARTRKNLFTFALSGYTLWGGRIGLGVEPRLDLRVTDLLLPGSLLSLTAAADLSTTQGAFLRAAYTRRLGASFAAFLEGEAEYDYTVVKALDADAQGDLSTFGYLDAGAGLRWLPGDYVTASVSYHYHPLWYEDKSFTVAGSGDDSPEDASFFGDLHTVSVAIGFDTLEVTQPLAARFLYNAELQAVAAFPFAGSLRDPDNGFPWYENLTVSVFKAWFPHPNRNFSADLHFSSYRGVFASRWTLSSPQGAGVERAVPGYAARSESGVPWSRQAVTAGVTYREEIVSLSNLLRLRTFLTLTVRGGAFWNSIGDSAEFAGSWLGGLRAAFQVETPLGTLLAGPELSFDGKLSFCLYFN